MWKRSERSNLANFLPLEEIFSKTVDNFVTILAWSFPRRVLMDLPKNTFDWSLLKVIFQGLKGQIRVWYFSYYFFCIKLLGVMLINYQEMDWFKLFKRLFSRSERSNFDLISRKQCMLWPMFLWNKYTESCIIFQFTLKHLILDDL